MQAKATKPYRTRDGRERLAVRMTTVAENISRTAPD
jgi:hypothetical protein